MGGRRPLVSGAAAKAERNEADTVVIDGKRYDRGWKSVVIYDDNAGADELADYLGATAKHAAMKGSPFKTISVVPFDD